MTEKVHDTEWALSMAVTVSLLRTAMPPHTDTFSLKAQLTRVLPCNPDFYVIATLLPYDDVDTHGRRMGFTAFMAWKSPLERVKIEGLSEEAVRTAIVKAFSKPADDEEKEDPDVKVVIKVMGDPRADVMAKILVTTLELYVDDSVMYNGDRPWGPVGAALE